MNKAPVIHTDLSVSWNGVRIGEINLDNGPSHYGLQAEEWDFGAIQAALDSANAGDWLDGPCVRYVDCLESIADILADTDLSATDKLSKIQTKIEAEQ